ncbi:MAG: RNA methyltransferase [Bacteroidia bacterium]|nr:RNA methyltransferase [Bacteroidia bacterium]
MRKLKLEELNRLSLTEFREAEKQPVTVVLDNIRSMHNVGAVLRTADAFRIEKVILCGITPIPPHREIHKTAIGAEDSVNWEYQPDILSTISELKTRGYKIYSIEQTDQSIALNKFEPSPERCAIVFGNEVEGVSQSIINISDMAIEIPQFGTKHSLNVSVAAGIVLYKFTVEVL